MNVASGAGSPLTPHTLLDHARLQDVEAIHRRLISEEFPDEIKVAHVLAYLRSPTSPHAAPSAFPARPWP